MRSGESFPGKGASQPTRKGDGAAASAVLSQVTRFRTIEKQLEELIGGGATVETNFERKKKRRAAVLKAELQILRR